MAAARAVIRVEMKARTHHKRAVRRAEQAPPIENFGAFYRAHVRSLEAFVGTRAGSAEATKDLVAETFATALVHRTQFRGSSLGQERAWLLAIARSQLSHHWRRTSMERRVVATFEVEGAYEEEPTLRIAHRCDVERARPDLLAALRALPAEQQRTVALRVVHDLEYEDIAAETGVSEDVARARVSRGLRTLARRLERRRPLASAA